MNKLQDIQNKNDSQKADDTKKKKKVLLVDDRLRQMEYLIRALEASLLDASLRRLDGAPKDVKDMEIIYFQITEGSKTEKNEEQVPLNEKIVKESEEVVSHIINRISNSFRNIIVPIEHRFICLNYEDDPSKNSEELIERMEAEIGAGDDIVVLLDLLLFPDYEQSKLNSRSDNAEARIDVRVLSHLVYDRFKKKCLLYSAFPPQAVLKKWCNIANIEESEIFPVEKIANGRATYIPFEKALLDRLGIQYKGRREK